MRSFSAAWGHNCPHHSIFFSEVPFIYEIYVRTNYRISDPHTHPIRTNYDVTMTTIRGRTHGAWPPYPPLVRKWMAPDNSLFLFATQLLTKSGGLRAPRSHMILVLGKQKSASSWDVQNVVLGRTHSKRLIPQGMDMITCNTNSNKHNFVC